MNEVEILNDAIDNLREHGWCRFQFENSVGEMCFRGALAKACTGHAWFWDNRNSFLAIEQRFQELWPGYDNPADWNNVAARDVDEVIERMKLLAESFAADPERKAIR